MQNKKIKFFIEDESHAEWQDGEYDSFESALAELKRRAEIAWDQEPNVCPCTSWKTCNREYAILECETDPWNEIRRVSVLEVSSKGNNWLSDPETVK